MELYHLHLKGIKDDKWKAKKEIIIDKDFTNRLGMKINNFNDCTSNPNLDNISNKLNNYFQYNGYEAFSKMPLYTILDFLPQLQIDAKTQKIILQELRNVTFQSAIFKREMAMENFRKDNNPKLPSRLHCVYATTENGINYWKERIIDNDIDIFKIEVLDEPFITSEKFIPNESNNYEEMYNSSFRYWNPKYKNIPEKTFEYLVQGKVKILEKVAEIKKQN